MNLIFAIGGTGQELLYYINQAYLCNAIEGSFKAYVIDTDAIDPGLQYLGNFYAQAAGVLADLQSNGKRIPSPPTFHLWQTSQSAAGTISEELSGRKVAAGAAYDGPLEAFFSRDDLSQNTQEGCYARPALASVVVSRSILDRITDTLVTGAKRIVVMGSLIGGTGGGLMVPVLAKLQSVCAPDTRIYSLALGDYFHPDEDKLSDVVNRFRSNRTMNRTLMMHAVPNLWKHALIEEPRIHKKTRIASVEPPFPAEDSPFWRALVTCKYMLEDTVADHAATFAANEIRWAEASPALSHPRTVQAIDNALGALQVLDAESPFLRISREPFPDSAWRNFYPFAAGLASLHHKSHGHNAAPRRFLDLVNRHIHTSASIKTRFPSRPFTKATPDRFRSLPWPDVTPHPRAEAFTNLDHSAQATPAATVFCAARLGGLQ